MREKPLIVNMLAGPCGCKSTIASELFAKMKWAKLHVELVSEIAKEYVWENNMVCLSNQFLISGQQHNREHRLIGKTDYVVTDCPLILGLVYYNKSKHFENFLVEEYKSQNNLNILLKRVGSYTSVGRMQTEEEAIILDTKIKELLDKHGIEYVEIDADESASNKMLELIRKNEK